MSKIFIGLMTSAGNAANFSWYNYASKYVDGLAVTWSGQRDEGFEILNDNKGLGFITERKWIGNHSHMMNDFFLDEIIRPGDWIILRDSSEIASEEFLKNIRQLIDLLENSGINSIFHYSKLFLFKKYEFQTFQSSPHWGLNMPQKDYAALEQMYPDKHESYSFSTRNQTRPSNHWIRHFTKYYLMDSSNHLLLGNENDPKYFQEHEFKRQEFKKYCESLRIPLTVDALESYFLLNKLHYYGVLPEKMLEYLNYEPILNDFYTHCILNHPHEEVSKRRQNKELFLIK